MTAIIIQYVITNATKFQNMKYTFINLQHFKINSQLF